MYINEVTDEQIELYAKTMHKEFLNDFHAPIEAWLQYVECCDMVTFKKDEIVKKQDKKEKYCYFILSGCVGVFLWSGNNFVCLDFFFDLQFCADYMSLLTNQITPLQLVALETTKMLRMTEKDYRMLTKKTVGSIIHLLSAETAFIEKQQQQIELLTKTAEEHYAILLERFSNINNRIAQKHIASYLGITPQSLSRVRATIK